MLARWAAQEHEAPRDAATVSTSPLQARAVRTLDGQPAPCLHGDGKQRHHHPLHEQPQAAHHVLHHAGLLPRAGRDCGRGEGRMGWEGEEAPNSGTTELAVGDRPGQPRRKSKTEAGAPWWPNPACSQRELETRGRGQKTWEPVALAARPTREGCINVGQHGERDHHRQHRAGRACTRRRVGTAAWE